MCLFAPEIDHTHVRLNVVTRICDLMQHKQIHTEDEHFYVTFTRKSSLTRHHFIQTQDKPFRCENVKKSFKRKGDLGKHILFHNGARPYECETCGKSHKKCVSYLAYPYSQWR